MLQICQNQCIEEWKIKSQCTRSTYILLLLRLGSRDSSLIPVGISAIFSDMANTDICHYVCMYVAIASSINAPTRTCGHRTPSAVGTYCIAVGPRGDLGLWALIALSHPQHPHPNKEKEFAHGFVFAFAFCLRQSSSM